MNVWISLKFSPTRGTKQQSYYNIGFYQKTILAKHYTSVSFGKNLSCLYINYALVCVMNELMFQDSLLLTHISSVLAVTLYLSLALSKHWILAYTIEQTDVYASKLEYRAPLILAKDEKFLKSSKRVPLPGVTNTENGCCLKQTCWKIKFTFWGQGCRTSWRQATAAPKFCVVAHNICGCSVLVTLMSPRILRVAPRFLENLSEVLELLVGRVAQSI